MLYVLVVLGFVSAVLCAPTQDEGRILNGKPAELFKYPFQVSVQEKKSGGGASKFCGGVILENIWILTAAHCFDSYPEGYKPNLYINAGVLEAYDYGSNSQYIKVDQVYSHPEYNATSVENDIALLKLSAPLKYNQQVRPVPTCPEGYDPTGEGDIIGWGAIDKFETVSSSELLVARTSVSKPEDCKKYFEVLNSQICLGAKVNNNACFGDSGGPFIQNVGGKTCVAGVTSYGDEGCDASKPIIYTKVNFYLDFINKILKK